MGCCFSSPVGHRDQQYTPSNIHSANNYYLKPSPNERLPTSTSVTRTVSVTPKPSISVANPTSSRNVVETRSTIHVADVRPSISFTESRPSIGVVKSRSNTSVIISKSSQKALDSKPTINLINSIPRSIVPLAQLDQHSLPNDILIIQEDSKPTSFLQLAQLDEYPLPNYILNIERGEDDIPQHFIDALSIWSEEKDRSDTNEERYINAYKMMAFFEEAVDTLEINKYKLHRVQLNRVNKKSFYFMAPPESNELFAAIDDELLYRFNMRTNSTAKKFNGKIISRESERINVEIYPGWECDTTDTHSIIFEINRTGFQLQHNALNFIKKHSLYNALINNPSYHCQDSIPPLININHTNPRQSNLNEEQMQAIEFIINGEYNPRPYLLYGPPGTGKTKTIVAAIEKIVRTTTKNVLVCAQSNAACNEIAERLCKILDKKELLRMFSMSYDIDKITSTLEPFSNLYDGELKLPSLEYLYEFRVLICTLSAAGCLVRARNNSNFNAAHYGYVFIDECASAHETMALIPIAGLCTEPGIVHANIVLIGDPKQLDAVTKSKWSIEMGFKTSLFERLFNLPLYQRYTSTGEYNQKYITQLIQNYRSHRFILKIPNELFYENTLQAMAKPELITLELEGLLSKNFPIIFKSVHGICTRPKNETSSYNMDEVNAVMEFVNMIINMDKFTQSDIGIVTPYKLQCKMIKQRCVKNNYKEIMIGSAEVFQGQEKPVMIVSTVRSGRNTSLGDFLQNAQRFNVMLTRAKNLLIVVGNPHLLSTNSNWRAFIEYCFKKRCLIQEKPGKPYFRPKK